MQKLGSYLCILKTIYSSIFDRESIDAVLNKTYFLIDTKLSELFFIVMPCHNTEKLIILLNTYFILFIFFFSIVAEEIPEEEVMMETVAAEAIIL